MSIIFDRPLLIFIVSFLLQWLAANVGDFLRRRRELSVDERADFSTLLTASLTLLALLIGFSLSMAVSRYDQRKNYEEAEASAIGTEYVRADLLPADVAARVRELLSRYADQRIIFYQTRDEDQVDKVNAATAKIQVELWSTVLPAATAMSQPMATLVVSGTNDVLSSQGDAQAAWWNRIPIAEWALMLLIAFACNMLFGYVEHRKGAFLLAILPLVVSVSFFLIADIDGPRLGIIRVPPHNLIALAESIKSH